MGTTTYNSGECKDKVDVKFIIIIQIWENSFDIWLIVLILHHPMLHKHKSPKLTLKVYVGIGECCYRAKK